MMKKDWTGKKFYKLTFLRPTKKRGRCRAIIWKAQCECGKFTYIRPCDARRGKCKSCGCLQPEVAAEIGKLGLNRKYEPRISSARAIWGNGYKDCPFDVFLVMTQLPCHYCGRSPFRTFNVSDTATNYRSEKQKLEGNFIYNGLDRIDSEYGHDIDNIVPCCFACNVAKLDMTFEQFLDHIERMYHHTRKYR